MLVPAHLAPGASTMAGLPALVRLARTALDVSADPSHLLWVAVEQIEAALDEPASAWLHDAKASGLPAVTASNHPEDVVLEIQRGYAGGIDRAMVLAGGWLDRIGLTACVLVPVKEHARELGVLAVTRAGGRPAFTEAEIELLVAIADVTGAVMAQQRMLTDCLAALDDLRQQVEIVDHISEALISCDAGHQIVSWNAGAEATYGYSRSDALGCDLFALLATEFYAEGRHVGREQVLTDMTTVGRWDGELRQRRADGAPLIVLASLSTLVDLAGNASGLVSVNRDITAQRHDEHRAMHDPLTGLPNRRQLDATLYEAYARACRNGRTLAVLFIDLDGFKAINDTHGHASGDAVLVATAERLRAVLRDRDTVARLGGDEFVCIVEEAGNRAAVEAVVRRVADAVSVPIDLGEVIGTVGASIGVAIQEQFDPGTENGAEALLEAADQAMYVAKRTRCGAWFAGTEQPGLA